MMPSGPSSSSGSNRMPPGFSPSADPDRPDRAGRRPRAVRRRRSPRAFARRSSKRRWRGRHKLGATCVSGSAGSTTIADEAVPIERDRQGEADQAAAEDDDVAPLHFPALALHCRNAKRLTRESARAHEGSGEHLGHSEWRRRQHKTAGPDASASWRDGSKRAARRTGGFLAGIATCLAALFALVALVSYRPSDPSLNTDAGGPVGNWMGSAGAWTSDLLLSRRRAAHRTDPAADDGAWTAARPRQRSRAAGFGR